MEKEILDLSTNKQIVTEIRKELRQIMKYAEDIRKNPDNEDMYHNATGIISKANQLDLFVKYIEDNTEGEMDRVLNRVE